jgi:hypothetical protein
MDNQGNNLPALAEQRQQLSQRSDTERELEAVLVALRTVEPRQALAEIAACLTLVAPSGMNADDRAEWLKVARVTVGDVSQGALQAACEEVRKRIRRVSDLVPTIIEEVESETRRLESRASNLRWRIAHPPVPQIEAPAQEEAKPFTLDELLKMPPHFINMVRRNGFAEPETLAEFDRRMEERRTLDGHE